MSDVRRYDIDENGVCTHQLDGAFVSYEDYASLHYERIHDLNQIGGLQEENARLKAEVERLDTLCKQVMAQHSDISCENIMLRKANDQLAEVREFHAGFNRALFNETVTENARLKAEVERLTKAITRGASTPDAHPHA